MPSESPSKITSNEEKPIYLQAFTENNLPTSDWGPKRKVDQTGLYQRMKESFTNGGLSSSNNSILPSTVVDHSND
ncbi:unnamed protein product [Rotaria sp. Silwood1]|nr:unnamed protein product [Rotaria sp. Silwood1]CAF4643081.1 unnamed protein product [Rotaria sp. Silwood1]CAF4682791.1 unnamed protein product [Rotaria sp. Silwood1]CAF4766910.1 unnamed protein product [Rotaria sp. Silwood1]